MNKVKINPHRRHKARQLSLQALYQFQLSGNEPKEIEETCKFSPVYRKSDKEYFLKIFRGVVEHREEIAEIISQINKSPDIYTDPIMNAVLQIGVYELKYCPELDYPVIINEALLLCHEFLHQESHAFANIMLDQAVMEVRGIQTPTNKAKVVPAEETDEYAMSDEYAASDETVASGEEPTEPAEETAMPDEETAASAEETAVPAEEPATPDEETAASAEETAAPAEEPATPDEETAAPIKKPAASTKEPATSAKSTTPAKPAAPAEEPAAPA